MKYKLIILCLSFARATLANDAVELPLDASKCAIAQALNAPLPAQCRSSQRDAPRGVVIRLDDKIQAKRTKNTARKIAPKIPKPVSQPALNAGNSGYFIQFELNSAKLATKYQDHLRQLSAVLQTPALADSCLRITGHTDSRGSRTYNRRLSMQRALTVGTYLVQYGQIAPNRILISAKGKDSPLPNIPANAPQQRRVAFAAKPRDKNCAY